MVTLLQSGANLQGNLTNFSSSTGYVAVKISDTKLQFYDYQNDGILVGSLVSTYTEITQKSGIAFYGIKNKRLTIGYKDSEEAEQSGIHLLIDYPEITDDSLPYIKNTSSGTLFPGLTGGGIVVKNGLIKSWDMAGALSGNFNVSTPGGTYKLTFKQGLLTSVDIV